MVIMLVEVMVLLQQLALLKCPLLVIMTLVTTIQLIINLLHAYVSSSSCAFLDQPPLGWHH